MDQIQTEIEQLWDLLEHTLRVMDELSSTYIRMKDDEGKRASMKESEVFEEEVQKSIETAEGVLKVSMATNRVSGSTESEVIQISENQTPISERSSSLLPSPQGQSPSPQGQLPSPQGQSVVHRLKPLKVPEFDGDKAKFEDFWGLFASLLDAGVEPANVKMARLRQSLKGKALDVI